MKLSILPIFILVLSVASSSFAKENRKPAADGSCVGPDGGYTVDFTGNRAELWQNLKLVGTYKRDPKSKAGEDKNAWPSYGAGVLTDERQNTPPQVSYIASVDGKSVGITIPCNSTTAQ